MPGTQAPPGHFHNPIGEGRGAAVGQVCVIASLVTPRAQGAEPSHATGGALADASFPYARESFAAYKEYLARSAGVQPLFFYIHVRMTARFADLMHAVGVQLTRSLSAARQERPGEGNVQFDALRTDLKSIDATAAAMLEGQSVGNLAQALVHTTVSTQ
jgi:hypothetical protein